MKKVPKMISSKDLDYINDIFSWNMNLIKKLNYYMDEVIDEEIKETFKDLIDVHTKHINTLIEILKEENANG